ncbi:odorant receptor Or2-like [Anthonomus grandis grandis]|uniref:odorant receptor Or2-like n=1 Tax=Anthonomus grandis grandis TaxID=2921223 RepID=UPI0021655AFA|nr:odorant receptor Or2-like [Anthonomus grandis grandis]
MLTIALLVILGAIGTLKIKEYNQQNNATLESHLMYQTIIPLNRLEHIRSLFIIQALWFWMGLTYNTTTHVVFITILTYAAAQLEILQIRIRNYVGPEFSEKSGEEEIQEKIQDLKKLILDHKYIIGYIEHFNSSAKYIILMEFVLSSLDLASASASLIKMNSSEMGWLLLFATLLSLQIFLLGWTCNEIVIQSMAIGSAMYESKWYLLNKEAKQLSQIVIARAQKPIRMTIGPFGPMTNESAVMVIKAAYSYISLIRR